MTRPSKKPEAKLRRQLADFRRAVVPIRQYGHSVVIPLPKPIRSALDIQIGDRVLIELDTVSQLITITKDSEGTRQRAQDQISNVKTLNNLFQIINHLDRYGDPEWCKAVERMLFAITRHLKGEQLEPVTFKMPGTEEDDEL